MKDISRKTGLEESSIVEFNNVMNFSKSDLRKVLCVYSRNCSFDRDSVIRKLKSIER